MSRVGRVIRRLVDLLARRKKLVVLSAIVFGSLGAIPVFALGGYQLVEAVDSPAFCTQVCHDVHEAEAVTFKLSPHSEVPCSDCHVGEGTSNLVMSKFNGLKDIVPTFTGRYHKPIATPLKSMRPSTETCETCHWSEKFTGDVPVVKTGYATDEDNTKSTVALVLKLGGGQQEVAAGVHWHATAKVWYLPVDEQRRQIAWVATEDVLGNVTEFVDPDRMGEITPELIQANKREMDCVDCHNRVSHLFRSPGELIDDAITDGSIDIELPYIKKQGTDALVPQNKSLGEAYARIEAIGDFYKNAYPDVYENKRASLNKALAKLKEIAKLSTFDDGLDWNTHPNNSAHDKPDDNMLVDWKNLSQVDESSGCFRCHGNLLKVENPGQLNQDQVLNGQNIDQFVRKVNLTLEKVAKAPPVMSIDNVTAYLKTLAATANVTEGTSSENRTFGFYSGNATGASPSDNRTAQSLSDNLTALIPTGAYPSDFGLQADCKSCHYMLKSPLISPLAPATSHPVDGLEDCLVCHSPSSAKPFKTTHPWTTNEACSGCHQAAPKLKSLPTSHVPEDAKATPHDVKGLEDCLVCHGPTATQPLKKEHPWATNDTCASCHNKSETLKPIPLSTPPKSPEITHPSKGFENCLSCHGQPTVVPFTTSHPWSTNETCVACHKESAVVLDVSHPAAYVIGPKINHALAGLAECASCHRPTASHPWTNTQLCTKCHQPYGGGGIGGGAGGGGGGAGSGAVAPPPPPQAVAISHSIAGLESCIACHNTGGVRLFPADHLGRPNSMCLICHQPAPPATIPTSPGSLTAVAASAGQVNLTWNDNATNETGFRIERATTNNFVTNFVTTILAANTVSYNDTTTAGSTTYYYRVFAFNSVGDSAASNTATVTTPASTAAVPSAPTNLASSAVSATQISLSWLDNSATETGFRIDRATSSNFGTNLVSVNTVINAISYSDATVSGNTTYYYRVYAFNSAGNSAASNTASVTTLAITIDPSALYVTSCASCHGTNRQGGSASAVTASALSSVTLAQVTSVITNGVGTMPAYAASLTTAQIAALAEWLKGSPPVSPANLTASAINAGQVNLFWVDNSADETGFRIERATNNTFTANLFTATVAANSVSYSNTTTFGSTTYYYRVFAYNASGNSVASNTVSVTTPAPTVIAPATPTGVVANAVSSTEVIVNWLDNATTETGYRIDRATTSAFNVNLVTTTVAANTLSYTDTTVSGGITYYYRMYAFNAAGNSAASGICLVTTPDAPTEPAALYSTNCASCHGANRQGGSASALTTSALANRSLSQVNGIISNGTAGMPGYSATMNSTQMSALAQWLKGTPPSAANGLTATAASAGQVNLSWTDNSADETGFRLERATNNAFTANLVTVTGIANSVSYSDMTVAGSTTYYYRVYATNSVGDSAASNTATVTTPAPTVTAPSAPTGLSSFVVSATQVNLSWIDNASTETGYRVDRATNNAFTAGLVTINIASNAISYSDTTVSGSTTYYFRVYAFNSAGNSVASATVTATTPAAAIDPAALYTTSCASCHGANRQGGSASSLTSAALSSRTLAQVTSTITNGTSGMPGYSSTMTSAQISALAQWLKGTPPAAASGLAATAVSAGQVNLTWADNSGDETGFRVERATNNTFTANLVSATAAASAVSYSDTSTAGSTTYYYRVYAVNASGDSASSDTVSVTTPAPTVTAPAAPTGLTASVISAVQVNVSWIDNASTETGYRIDRATNNTFTSNLVTVNTASNAVSYSDTTVSGSATYYYRVYAFNSGGNSAASSTVTATTPAPGPAQIYSASCVSCHGSSGQGASGPAIAGAAAPTTNFIVRVGGLTMPGYTTSQISATALTGLATYVKGLGPAPTTGAGQYSLNCAVCHGATGQGTTLAPYVAGVPVSTLSSITRSGLGTIMPAYNTTDINSTGLTALANYIVALGPPPSDGWGVYAEYCVSCHGTSGQGGSGGRVAGDSPSTTSSAVRSGPDSMPSYTTTQISDTGLANLGIYVRNLVPSQPTGLTATAAGASQVNLTWTNNAMLGTITGMRVQRATNSAFSTGLVTINLGVVTSYSDTTVSGGTTYYYRVSTTNLAGTSAASNTATITTP